MQMIAMAIAFHSSEADYSCPGWLLEKKGVDEVKSPENRPVKMQLSDAQVERAVISTL